MFLGKDASDDARPAFFATWTKSYVSQNTMPDPVKLLSHVLGPCGLHKTLKRMRCHLREALDWMRFPHSTQNMPCRQNACWPAFEELGSKMLDASQTLIGLERFSGWSYERKTRQSFPIHCYSTLWLICARHAVSRRPRIYTVEHAHGSMEEWGNITVRHNAIHWIHLEPLRRLSKRLRGDRPSKPPDG